MRSLNTHAREGGLSVKIVLARFAPSKKANLSKSANFRFASLTPLATNPSAQLYGRIGNDVVRLRLRHQKIDPDLAKTTVVEVSAANGLAGFFQNAGHGTVASGREEVRAGRPVIRLNLIVPVGRDPA